jgi:hypothetical protein
MARLITRGEGEMARDSRRRDGWCVRATLVKRIERRERERENARMKLKRRCYGTMISDSVLTQRDEE